MSSTYVPPTSCSNPVPLLNWLTGKEPTPAKAGVSVEDYAWYITVQAQGAHSIVETLINMVLAQGEKAAPKSTEYADIDKMHAWIHSIDGGKQPTSYHAFGICDADFEVWCNAPNGPAEIARIDALHAIKHTIADAMVEPVVYVSPVPPVHTVNTNLFAGLSKKVRKTRSDKGKQRAVVTPKASVVEAMQKLQALSQRAKAAPETVVVPEPAPRKKGRHAVVGRKMSPGTNVKRCQTMAARDAAYMQSVADAALDINTKTADVAEARRVKGGGPEHRAAYNKALFDLRHARKHFLKLLTSLPKTVA